MFSSIAVCNATPLSDLLSQNWAVPSTRWSNVCE